MYCKKCGYEIKETELVCPFCNTIISKDDGIIKTEENIKVSEVRIEEKPNVFPENKIEKEENDYIQPKTVKEKIKNQLGYFNLRTSWLHHALIACGGYILMYIINIIVGRAMISYYRSQGMDFSCIAENPDTFMEVCPIEPIQAYLKVSSLSQIIAELSVVAIVAFIFIKSIKLLFNSFKDKNTMKWYGLGLAIMYGGNYIYSMILTGLNLESTSSNQDAVNEIIFGTPLIGFLFVVIAAPLFEEIIFRFGIFRIFTHNNKKVETIGVILTTIAFAMVHMIATFSEVWADPAAPNYELLKSDLLSLPVYLIGAFGLTFAYHKSKSLATPMLMHMTYNGISFFALLLLGSLPEETGSIIINLFHLFL